MSNVQNTSTEYIGEKKYTDYFENHKKEALERALETRKFEIELYWKRATYFWTFIGATLGGFFVAYASSSLYRKDLLVILCCLGLVFSFAWFCVNKGSKYWQENWEKHVDLLENYSIGPLYKIVLSRNKSTKKRHKIQEFITGPQALSVSKINQLISAFMVLLWFVLLVHVLMPFDFELPIKGLYVCVVGLSLICCISFFIGGRSYSGGHYHTATLRKSRINPDLEADNNK
ncbi:TPA: hypothetical protein QH236_004858 [Serratia liquefaciens]|nr:hypothetical protein [Serratia liquefaciens]